MTILPISLTLAAVAAIINIWLTIRVGQMRTREKVMVGDGGNEFVIRRMRAHSNYVENTAFVMLLIVLIELGFGSSIWLWAAGGLYFVGRIAHAIGMDGPMNARFAGTLSTFILQIALALAAIFMVFMTPVKSTDTLTGTVTSVSPQ